MKSGCCCPVRLNHVAMSWFAYNSDHSIQTSATNNPVTQNPCSVPLAPSKTFVRLLRVTPGLRARRTSGATNASWTDHLDTDLPIRAHLTAAEKERNKRSIGFTLHQEHRFQSNVLKVQLNCRLEAHKCIPCVPHSTNRLRLRMNLLGSLMNCWVTTGIWRSPKHF